MFNPLIEIVDICDVITASITKPSSTTVTERGVNLDDDYFG